STRRAAGPLAREIASLDVAAQVMMRDTLSQDSRCTTWPTGARQDRTRFELIRGTQTGNLVVHVTVPNLVVNFSGECQGLISTIPVDGYFSTTIEMYSMITPVTPPAGDCLHAFGHGAPDVTMANWQFDVHGNGLGGILVELFGGNQGPAARDRFQQEFTMQADTMLGMRLANVQLFNKEETMDFKGVPVTVGMCMMALQNPGASGPLRAVIGAHTSGPGTSSAPGAPQFDGALPAAAPNTPSLDTTLLPQLPSAPRK